MMEGRKENTELLVPSFYVRDFLLRLSFFSLCSMLKSRPL